jgi:hypothetical protein
MAPVQHNNNRPSIVSEEEECGEAIGVPTEHHVVKKPTVLIIMVLSFFLGMACLIAITNENLR